MKRKTLIVVLIVVSITIVAIIGVDIRIKKYSKEIFDETIESLLHADYYDIDIHGYGIETVEITDIDTVMQIKEAISKIEYDKPVFAFELPDLVRTETKIYDISVFDSEKNALIRCVVSDNAVVNVIWNAPNLPEWIKITLNNTHEICSLLDKEVELNAD